MSGLALLLIGAGIALVSGLIGAGTQQVLSIRADKLKRGRDKTESSEPASGPELIIASGEVIHALADIEKQLQQERSAYYFSGPREPWATVSYMSEQLDCEELGLAYELLGEIMERQSLVQELEGMRH